MGSKEVLCPHCESKKISLEFTDFGELKKIKKDSLIPRSASWFPTMTQNDYGEWIKDSKIGIAIRCDCSRHYFIHSFQFNPISFEVSKNIPSSQHIVIYCDECGAAFIDSTMKCPKCGKQY